MGRGVLIISRIIQQRVVGTIGHQMVHIEGADQLSLFGVHCPCAVHSIGHVL